MRKDLSPQLDVEGLCVRGFFDKAPFIADHITAICLVLLSMAGALKVVFGLGFGIYYVAFGSLAAVGLFRCWTALRSCEWHFFDFTRILSSLGIEKNFGLYLILYGLFFGWLLLTTLWTSAPVPIWKEDFFYICVLVSVIALTWFCVTRETSETFLIYWVVGALAVGAYVLKGTMGAANANEYLQTFKGVQLTLATPQGVALVISFFYFQGYKGRKGKILWALLTAFFVSTVARSVARGTLVFSVFAVAVVIGFCVWHYRKALRARIEQIGLALVALALMIAGLLATVWHVKELSPRIVRLNTLSGRVPIWEQAFKNLMEAPVFGRGLGMNGVENAFSVAYPHNLFLHVGVDGGFVAVLMLAALMLGPMILFVKRFKANVEDPVYLSFFAVLIFLIMEFSKSYDFYAGISLVVASVLAMKRLETGQDSIQNAFNVRRNIRMALNNLPYQFRNLHFYWMLLLDLTAFAAALVGAYLLRFDFVLTKASLQQIWALLPWIVSGKAIFFLGFGLYRGMWRYTSLGDIWRLLMAVFASSLAIVAVIAYLTRFQGFSRGIFVLDAGLTFLMAGGFRMVIRTVYHYRGRQEQWFTKGKKISAGPRRKVLVVGAGDAGEKTIREARDNPTLTFEIAGFVDDDRFKLGKNIHGFPVLGKIDDLPNLVQTMGVEEVFIAIPSATGQQMRHIVELCEQVSIPYKTLPGMGDLMNGRVSIKALRDVRYEDLLGRPPVNLELTQIAGYLKDQVVLITGAGGSIGRELSRQVLCFDPAALVLLDVSEPGLYESQMELKHRKGYLKYRTVLGSICDRTLVDKVFKQYRPKVVFHAAAYKHVPMLERNPWQAVVNNVRGTKTLLEAAVRNGCRRFVMISTDKAVRPTNVMGASKRVCERLLYAYMGGQCRLMSVRFGNVVGSAGSVIPLFESQIERGGPVTVTHPDVTRYFMTIPEACQLVLQAGSLGTGGEIFVLEMGTQVKIADMARDLIRLSGKDPDRDIEVVYTGLRPGEKLYEELITDGEGIVATEHEKIMVIRPDGCYDGYGDEDGYRRWILEAIDDLELRAASHDSKAIREGLKKIVPEYEEQEAECVLV